MTACYKCGTQKTPLLRQNQKGVKGIFACEAHSKIQADGLLQEVINIFKNGEGNAK